MGYQQPEKVCELQLYTRSMQFANLCVVCFITEEYMTFYEADFEPVVIQDSHSNINVTLKVKFIQTNTEVRLNNHNNLNR